MKPKTVVAIIVVLHKPPDGRPECVTRVKTLGKPSDSELTAMFESAMDAARLGIIGKAR